MYLYQCYVTDTWKQCDNPVPVVRSVKIPWNPDSETITVSTNSVAGSEEKLSLIFYDKDRAYAGGVWISFYTQIKYYIIFCMDVPVISNSYKPFPVTLPIETQKTWTITYNYTDKRVVLHCNGVEVLNVVVSNSVCTRTDVDWRDYWKRKPTQIDFFSDDTASDKYCISSNAGKYYGCY